jgi:hypothetical protein
MAHLELSLLTPELFNEVLGELAAGITPNPGDQTFCVSRVVAGLGLDVLAGMAVSSDARGMFSVLRWQGMFWSEFHGQWVDKDRVMEGFNQRMQWAGYGSTGRTWRIELALGPKGMNPPGDGMPDEGVDRLHQALECAIVARQRKSLEDVLPGANPSRPSFRL